MSVATSAHAFLLSGLASEIVLIDANRAQPEGEAMDLNHAVLFTPPTRMSGLRPADDGRDFSPHP
jgi:L-lactate dehydrogenase